MRQLTQLALIYGRSFHSLFAELARAVKPELASRLDTLPHRKRPPAMMLNRLITLKRLRARLTGERHAA